MLTQSIPCPECGTKIIFDPARLINGETFECAHCHLAVSLGGPRHPDITRALKTFAELKPHLEGKT